MAASVPKISTAGPRTASELRLPKTAEKPQLAATGAAAEDQQKCESRQKLDDYSRIARERQKEQNPLVKQLMQKAAKTPEQAEKIMAIAEARIDTEVSKEIDQKIERGEFFYCSGCSDPNCNKPTEFVKLTGNSIPS